MDLYRSAKPVTLSFEFRTPLLGSESSAYSQTVNDDLPHNISASLSGLIPGSQYYYRIKGQTSQATF